MRPRALLAPALVVAALSAGALGCKDRRREEPAATRPSVPPRQLTPAEARAKFCRQVFPVLRVQELAGVADLMPLPAGQAPAQGVGACRYKGPAASSPEVSLVVDCRIDHPDLATLRQLAEGKPGFREVAIGAGGVYTGDAGQQRHRLAFVHERPSCAIFVATSRLAADRTGPLAAHVVASLGGAGAPR